MENKSGLFTRWYKELASFNFTVVHKKGKENSNADALRRSSHMAKALPLAEDKYAEFYKIDEPVIQFEDGVWQIYLPESMVIEVWSLCHQSDLGGRRGLEWTLNKFLKGFFLLSARQKICFLNGGCDTCLTCALMFVPESMCHC